MAEKLVITQEAATETLADSSADLESAQSQHEQVTSRVLIIGALAALAGLALLVGMHRREGVRLWDALGREAAQRTVADELQRGLFPGRLPDMIVLGPGPSVSISMAGRVESRLTVPAERAGSKLHSTTLPSAWPETQQVWVQALDSASL